MTDFSDISGATPQEYRERLNYRGETSLQVGGEIAPEKVFGGKHADKLFHLPQETAVYVPSTQDVDQVISLDQMEDRVNEVKRYLANLFGGYTASETVGGFVDSKGNLVNEEVVKVTAFAQGEKFAAAKDKLLKQLSKWAKKWGQEAIGFEYEGDLFYVPESFEKGGVLLRKGGELPTINWRAKVRHGTLSRRKVQQIRQELMDLLAERGLTPADAQAVFGYNPIFDYELGGQRNNPNSKYFTR